MTRLTYKIIGQGPDLVLLHGWGMHAAIWRPVVAQLAAYYRLTLIDLPGHGENRGCLASTPDEVIAQLIEVVPQEAHWVGWSLGGQVASRFALAYPEQVRRLMLVASNPCFVSNRNWPHAMRLAVLEQFAASLDHDWSATVRRFIALQFMGTPVPRGGLRSLQQEMIQLPADPEALRLGLQWLKDIDLSADILNLEMPVVFLLGSLDRLVPVQLAETLSDLNFAVRVVEGAGHAPFISHPEVFIDQLTEFLTADTNA